MTRDTQDIRVVNILVLSLSPHMYLLSPHMYLLPLSHLTQGVVGTEHSLKSALVAAFTDGELDLEGDEPGTSLSHAHSYLSVYSPLIQMAELRQS